MTHLTAAPTSTPAIPVTVPSLGIHGTLVRVVPSSTVGGETRFVVRWYEPAAKAHREAGFWLEDLVFEAEAVEAEAA